MNEKEAIRRIMAHKFVHFKSEERAIKITEALDMSIKALEKQIPKKLIAVNGGYTLYGCPTCDYSDALWSLKKKDKYCPNCGQALD